MKKFLLISLFIIAIALIGEMGLRFSREISVSNSMAYYPMMSKKGYALNPDHGVIESKSLHIQYHFYSPHLRDTPIKSNVKSILVLGDSFTFGWLLSWDNTYVHKLQVKMDQTVGKNKYQFLNAATPAWGTLDQLLYLEEFGERISPAVVLVFINTDDIGRSIRRDIYKIPEFDLLPMIESYRPIKALFRSLAYDNWIYQHSVLLQTMHDFIYEKYQFIFNVKSRYGKVIFPMTNDLVFRDEFAIRYAEDLFIRMNKWCKEHQATLLVMTTGYNAFYPADSHDPTQIFLNQAKIFFAKESIPYLDIGYPFKAAVLGKEMTISREEHPNDMSATLIADLSWPWIKQHTSKS